ncbi:MAG: glycosyltransferase family 9 protein [Elusimicrobiales bacterium]|nr:glycosyltransferase family 9 protein [Elusimicrobiales bacterium]
MNFLIIVYKGIGDVILTTPVIKAIKRNFNNSKIFFLTKKYSADILKNNYWVDEILIRENLKISYLRSLKIDVSIDYMLSSSSAFYSLISGAKKRIAFWRNWGFIVYNLMVKSEWDGYNVIKRFECLKAVGLDWRKIDDIKPEVYLLDDEKKRALRVFESYGLTPKKDFIISFDITSPRIERQPEADVFIYFADKLVEKGYKTVFLASNFDFSYIENSVYKFSKYKEKHIVIKHFSIRELASSLSLCDFHIGTSSAPMHISVSLNIPTFTLYNASVTNPRAWTPPNSDIHSYIASPNRFFDKVEVWSFLEKHINKVII